MYIFIWDADRPAAVTEIFQSYAEAKAAFHDMRVSEFPNAVLAYGRSAGDVEKRAASIVSGTGSLVRYFENGPHTYQSCSTAATPYAA